MSHRQPRILWLGMLGALSGCRTVAPPGVADTPPLPRYEPGTYCDINPRWSHDGKRIAYLRSTPDRRFQLFVADAGLDRPLAVLEAELVSPDRRYGSSLKRYCSQDTIAWSPDDSHIAFERTDWFKFEDGERLPGTGIWSYEVKTGRVQPLALHPARYGSLFYFYHYPSWSPDGRYLTFVTEGINGQRAIAIRAIAWQKAKELAPRFDKYSMSDWPVWRPLTPRERASGRAARPEFAYVHTIFRSEWLPTTTTLRRVRPGDPTAERSGEQFRMTPDGYRKTFDDPPANVEPRAGNPVWSPSGRRIAFTLTPDALEWSRYEIWVLDLQTRRASRVAAPRGMGLLAPVWIDERRIGALTQNGDHFDVVALGADRPFFRKLGAIDSADADWSPDRTQIVYSARPIAQPVPADETTTLRVMATGLRTRAPWRSNSP